MNRRAVRSAAQTFALILAVLAPTLALRPAPAGAELESPEAVVDALVADLKGFYAQWMGSDYRAPAMIYWYNTGGNPGATASACGALGTNNAFYCGRDESIYLDYTYLDYLLRAGGDYTVGFVLAHEWAHHVQHLYGILGRVFSIESELQADCLTGVYSRHLDAIGMLEVGDADEAYALAEHLGDAPGTDPWHKGAHGTGDQRQEWFAHGYNQYTWAACETYNA